jgi:hypothetical protein
MTLERRQQIGSQHRGLKVSDETRVRMSESQTGLIRGPHTNEAKKRIGLASSAKFTDEYKKKDRLSRETLGQWIPLDLKDDYEFYRELSNWIEPMFNFVNDTSQLELLNERGVFNNVTNTTGVVRDHIFSRRSGLKHGVFPEIVRHPCNLQLLSHGQNVSKGHGTDDHQTLPELFQKIRDFRDTWHEQDRCLQLIDLYDRGERYQKGSYIK